MSFLAGHSEREQGSSLLFKPRTSSLTSTYEVLPGHQREVWGNLTYSKLLQGPSGWLRPLLQLQGSPLLPPPRRGRRGHWLRSSCLLASCMKDILSGARHVQCTHPSAHEACTGHPGHAHSNTAPAEVQRAKNPTLKPKSFPETTGQQNR